MLYIYICNTSIYFDGVIIVFQPIADDLVVVVHGWAQIFLVNQNADNNVYCCYSSMLGKTSNISVLIGL